MAEKITVMHVDDDEDIRTITELALSMDPDIELRQFSSGTEAIEHADEVHPDVLLLDMMMPGMTGEETWEHLKTGKGLADVPAVFMSARAEEEFAKALLAKGAAGVITKPFDPMTLSFELKSKLG